MAEPKKNLQKSEEVPTVPVATRPSKKIERAGASRSAYTRRWPRVIGGQCEACGVMDRNAPPEAQYKLCPHYQGLELRCSYCDELQDPNQVIIHNAMNIAEHPDDPDKLVVWCNSYKCLEAHKKRFTASAN